MATFMLTTTDNPYNPHRQYDEWRTWDVQQGYHTESYLARIVITSDGLSPAQQDLDLLDAIEEILEFNLSGTYAIAIDADEDWLIAPDLETGVESKTEI